MARCSVLLRSKSQGDVIYHPYYHGGYYVVIEVVVEMVHVMPARLRLPACVMGVRETEVLR